MMMSIKRILAIFIVFMLGISLYPLLVTSENHCSERAPRQATVSFTNVTDQAGLSGVSSNSFSWSDYNNDGYEDLLVSGKRLFRNNGPPGWNFTEVTSLAGLTSSTSGGVWGDYDNDGYLDIYSVGRTSDTLYHNNGNETFTDVTTPAGNIRDDHPTVAAGWGDYDRDGYIDLYVANGEDWNDGNPIFYPNKLYHNNGNGTFTEVTVAAGVDDSSSPRYSRGVNWGDFNNDGWLDIHVSNYRLLANYLWENNQDGTFTEVAGEKDVKGVYDPDRYYDAQVDGYYGPLYGHTIGSAWADYDNDGDFDMWTSNLVHKYVGPTSWPDMPYDIRGYVCDDSKLYENYGAPYYNFTDARNNSGIPFKPIGGSGTYQGDELFDGVAWGDFDNDGDLDLWIPQVYDLNYAYSYLYEQDGVGTGHFTDRANELNMLVYNTYAGCWCDYDNDGDLDLITAGKRPFVAEGQGTYEIHLFRNNGNTNNYLKLKLNGTAANSYAIGARVKVTTGTTTMMREVEGGMGCNAHQNSLTLHFGLGPASIVDEVEVRWPDGRLQFLNNVAINQLLEISEPSTPLPTVTNVQVSPGNPVEDVLVTFTAQINAGSATVTNLQWDFEADNVFDFESTSYTAQQTYTVGGQKHVRLRLLTDQSAGIDYYPIEFEVLNLAPVADFDCNLSYSEDEVAVFDATASTDTASDLQQGFGYKWRFGDGDETNWSVNQTVNHAYTEDGDYTMNLSVKDIDGVIGYAVKIITVHNVPPVIETLPTIFADEDEEINFTANVTDTGSDVDGLWYKWDFGDGAGTIKWEAKPEASHVYTAKGNYTAKLIARDDDLIESVANQSIVISNPAPRCVISQYTDEVNEDVAVDFNGGGTDTPSDVPTLEYSWDFGDNNIMDWGDELSLTHTFANAGNYNVTLYVKDDDGSINYSEVMVVVKNVAPTCTITNADMDVDEDELVVLNGTATDTESDLTVLQFQWDLGNGNITAWSASPGAIHTYTHKGVYEIVMYVKDNNDQIAASESIEISVENVVPTARGTASEYIVDEGEEIEFAVSKFEDTESDMPFLTYEWDFVDSTGIAEGISANHTFYESGDYKVKLTVYDDDGDHSTYRLKTITVNNIPPVASFYADRTDIEVGDKVYFSAWNTTDSMWELAELRFSWKFGDGKSGSGMNVSHIFKSAGKFKVTLTVYDDDDVTSTQKVFINVTEPNELSTTDEGFGDLFLFAALGGVAFLIVIFALVFLLMRKKKAEKAEGVAEGGPPIPVPVLEPTMVSDDPAAGAKAPTPLPLLPPLPPGLFPPPPPQPPGAGAPGTTPVGMPIPPMLPFPGVPIDITPPQGAEPSDQQPPMREKTTQEQLGAGGAQRGYLPPHADSEPEKAPSEEVISDESEQPIEPEDYTEEPPGEDTDTHEGDEEPDTEEPQPPDKARSEETTATG